MHYLEVVTFIIAFCLGLAFTEIRQCMDDGEFSVFFEGSPGIQTPALLNSLRNANISAVFLLDSEKLENNGVMPLVESMMRDGHAMGISFGNSTDLSGMSNDGLRGTIEARLSNFEKISGNRPILIKVPKDTNDDTKKAFEMNGFVLIAPQVDFSKVELGDCVRTFNDTNLQTDNRSFIMGFSDAGDSCSTREISKILNLTETKGMRAVGMAKCVGLTKIYKEKNVDIPLDFSLREVASSTTSSLPTVSNFGANENAGNSYTNLPSWYKPLFAAFVLVVSCALLL